MKRIVLHEIFSRAYWIWMSLMVDLGVLHETHYTTWAFEAYAVKGICWLDGWYYTISFILHGLFARVYWNWMPLMVDLDVQHETHCSTWLFCLCILDLNASDGGFRCATWNSLFNMAFLHVYTGIECYWWMNGWYSMLVDLEVQHETHYSTWLFCTCISNW